MKQSHRHSTIKIEKIGFYVSLLCAIHCIATPLLVTLLPYVGGHLLQNHTWELWFILGSVVLAGAILWGDYKKHQYRLPLTLLLASLSVKALEVLWLGEAFEFITGALGGLLIALAYYFNWKYKAACTC